MDTGWIKIHRCLLEWEWYDDINVKVLFLHLLLRANHKPSNYRGHLIPAGAIVGGYPALAEQLGLSVRNIRTALSKLKSTGEVTVKTTSKFSIIMLTKWDEYQMTDRQSDSQVTGKRQASDSQPTTSKECKNEEGKNERNMGAEPPPPKQTRKASKSIDYTEDFEQVWKGYLPYARKREYKEESFQNWREGFRKGHSLEELMEHARELIRYNKKQSLQYRKAFHKWFEPRNISSIVSGEQDQEKAGQDRESLMEQFFGPQGKEIVTQGHTVEEKRLEERA